MNDHQARLRQSLLSRLKLRHLTLLQLLSKGRHLSQVASDLGLTQPAVTKSLREIEDIFMTRLFDRTAQGLRALPAGRAVLDFAQLALADVDSTSRVLAAIEGGHLARIRVGVIPDLPRALRVALLSHLTEKDRRISIAIQEGSTQDLMNALAARELDCVIGRSNHHGDDVLQQTVLRQLPCLLVANDGHRRLARRKLNWATLFEMNWIMQPAGSTGRQTVEAIFIAAGVNVPTPILETHSLQSIEVLLRLDPNAVCILAREAAVEISATGAGAILPFAVDWDLPAISFFAPKDSVRQKLILGIGVAIRSAASAPAC